MALPATLAEITKTWQGKVKQWGPMLGDNLTTQPIIPTALKGTSLTLEVQKKIAAKYPELQLPIILQIGAGAAFAPTAR